MEVRKQLPQARRMWIWPERHNPSKYYLYHHNHENDTKDCLQLEDEIKWFI